MNTKNLKAYAPKARNQFIDAVTKRAAFFGIYQDEIMPITFQGDTAIINGEAFTKAQGRKRQKLEKQIEQKGFELFIREMAYTWFNRLAALRYMELHDYLEHGFRVLSHPTNNEGMPEILDHASDVADMLALKKVHITELQLAGDQQEPLYRELLLGQCHYLHSIMPFLFEAIDDATELLLPDNLTKTDSILKSLVNNIPEEDWQDIEVIGWLYQFYISEHKDAVIGKVVKSEDIPAATQLFTPNWIVKYLVQNSIGRQWLETYPDSGIRAKMEYYIEPPEQSDKVKAQLASVTPSSIEPESIKALDLAAGSGHILVEMYELLREIYLERGYRLREIPELILTKNIYGLDIDDRAAQLAGFALMMKAREDDRRIFQRVQDGSLELNVRSIQSTEGWDSKSLWHGLNLDGKAKQGSNADMFFESKSFDMPTGEYLEYFKLLQYLIVSFEHGKTLGSLIQIEHKYLTGLKQFKNTILSRKKDNDQTFKTSAQVVLPILDQAIILAQRYSAICANPPYLGGKGMNAQLKNYAKREYPNSKADLFAMFMERAFKVLNETGLNAQVNMQAWMFISRFEKIRRSILENHSIITLAHLGPRAFSQISGEVVQTSAWVITKKYIDEYTPSFIRLVEGNEFEKRNALREKRNVYSETSQQSFRKIPSAPIAYWIDDKVISCFETFPSMKDFFEPREGLATGSNDLYVRYWYEVDSRKILRGATSRDVTKSEKNKKWFPYNKGGEKRRWYGNDYFVVDWGQDGEVLQNKKDPTGKRIWAHNFNLDYIFRPMLSWSDITSKGLSARFFGSGYLFDATGLSAFDHHDKVQNLMKALAICNSHVGNLFANILNPTLHFKSGDFARMSYNVSLPESIVLLAQSAIDVAKTDFDLFESSHKYASHPLIQFKGENISQSLANFEAKCIELTKKLTAIETEINHICVEAYGLSELEFKNENPTLLVNYESNFAKAENAKASFTSQTIVSLISYYIGIMMARYSISTECLIYAFSGNESFKEVSDSKVYQPINPDDDGIIPLAAEEWLFEDDATEGLQKFVGKVWDSESISINLEFVAQSLCLDALKARKDERAKETIRRYFCTQFFNDHCKTYNKRPIYWLFSSGKEKAFECLVYLHRYNEATLSRMRTDYVTPLMGKYDHQLARKADEVMEASGTEVRRIEKEIKDLEKKQVELRNFDEELKHYAEMRITLDLDDGVKVNYGKFGNLLANVKGIHGKAVK
jgi:type II restriction/modification system DNA methylase subunit YeeA